MSRPLVLAYHGLAEVPFGLDPDGLMVSPDDFRRHVGRLRRRGYRFVALSEFVRRLEAADALDGICALTFDDAPANNATVLPPLLEELDLCATVYACPGLLGEAYPFVAPETGIRFCTADELSELAHNPRIEIGSHTRRHTVLADADGERALEEMDASRAELEDLLGVEVRSFAYPECAYSPDCPDAARRAGYSSAVTCGGRGGLRPFELRRESPSPTDGPVAFELKVHGVFFRVRDLWPVRIARRVLRPLRYR